LSVNNKTEDPQIFFEDFFSTNKIANKCFWPFINMIKKEKKYYNNSDNNEDYFKIKEREINYASHMDSYIYSYYSYVLNEKYNNYISNYRINDEILAYRNIKNE
jgi:RNA-directed DNA polymerase